MKKIYSLILVALMMATGFNTAAAQTITADELEGKYDLYGDITYEKKYQERGLKLYGYYRVELVRDNRSENGFYLANHLLHALIFTGATEVEAVDGYYCEYDEDAQLLHVTPMAKGQYVQLLDYDTYRYYFVKDFKQKEYIYDIQVMRGQDGYIYLSVPEQIDFVTPNDERTAYEYAFHIGGFLARKCDQVSIAPADLYGTYDFAYSLTPDDMTRTEKATLTVSPNQDETVKADALFSVLGCSNMVIGYDYNGYGFMATYVADEESGFLFEPMQPDNYLHCTFMSDGVFEFDGPVSISSNAFEGIVYYGRATKSDGAGVADVMTQTSAAPKIYGIDGRQHRLPLRGINIINGKKVIR